MKKILLLIFIFLFTCGFSVVKEDNPLYIDYINSSIEEKKEYDLVPEPYVFNVVVDSSDVFKTTKKTKLIFGTIPSRYDLRNRGVVPKTENQGNLGLCWAFSTYYCLNSNHLINGKQTKAYSKNHLDYVANYVGDSYYFGQGNNMYSASKYWTFGYGPVTESHFGSYFTSYKSKEISDYLDNKHVVSDILETKAFPQIDIAHYVSLGKTLSWIRGYLDIYSQDVKEHIMNYGAVSTGVYWDFYNPSTKTVYYDGSYCDYSCTTSAHAATIIGWDDNYDAGIVINGEKAKGAWLAKNTWGEGEENMEYYYISYFDTLAAQAMLGIVSSEDKNWDYSYVNAFLDKYTDDKDSIADDSASYLFYKGDNKEKIESLKIFYFGDHYSDNSYFDIEICDSKKCVAANERSVLNYGLHTYTFDNFETSENVVRVNIDNHDSKLSSEEDNYFTKNNGYFNYYITLFTSDSDSNKDIYIENVSEKVENKEGNVIDLKIITKNILTNTDYSIKMYDQDNNDISNKFTIEKNILINGYAEAKVTFKEVLNIKDLIINVSSDSISEEITFENIGPLGSKFNPYIISEVSDMDLLLNEEAYFELSNNIDMSHATKNVYGKYYNNGNGWNSIDFNGHLDGKNYTIYGLYSKTGGLFDLFNGEIRNLKISNFNVINNSERIGLIANSGDGIIDNLSVIESSIDGDISGSIYGAFFGGNLSNIYVSGSIYGKTHSGGLFGLIHPMNAINVSNVYLNQYNAYTTDGNSGYVAGRITVDDTNYIVKINQIKSNLVSGSGISASTFIGSSQNLTDQTDTYIYNEVVKITNSSNFDNPDLITNNDFSEFDNNYWIINAKNTYLKSFPININSNSIVFTYNSVSVDYDIPFNVSRNISKTSFINEVVVNNGNSYKIYNRDGSLKKDSDFMGTGSYICVNNEKDFKNYTIIVKGDGNGDGVVDISDVINAANASVALFENPNVLNSYEFSAYDVVNDNNVNINDVIKMANASVDINYSLD